MPLKYLETPKFDLSDFRKTWLILKNLLFDKRKLYNYAPKHEVGGFLLHHWYIRLKIKKCFKPSMGSCWGKNWSIKKHNQWSINGRLRIFSTLHYGFIWNLNAEVVVRIWWSCSRNAITLNMCRCFPKIMWWQWHGEGGQEHPISEYPLIDASLYNIQSE